MNALARRTTRFHTRRFRALLGGSSLCLLAVACGDDPTIIDGTGGTSTGNAGSGGSNTGSSGRAGSGGSNNAGSGGSNNAGSGGSNNAGSGGSAGAGGAPAPGGTIEVSGEITANTSWTKDNTYLLTDKLFVVGNSTLTIEPGTQIRGGGLGSALVVTRGSRLVAEGTAAEPIVFSSNIPVGLRDPGDWGGVVLLGAASINLRDPNNAANPIDGQIEGIEAAEGRGAYGGTNDAHDCGSLEYVRIEFAGFLIGGDNELNGLTLGACGTGTNIDYVQVHRGLDDGIEFFGGTAGAKHVVVSNAGDDSIDGDFGWRGQVQFAVVQHDPASDAGFEIDNGDPTTDATPRTEPTIYNATLVGTPTSGNPGVILRRGTWGIIRNSIITGFPAAGVDIRDAFSVDGTEEVPLRLAIENSILFQNGVGGIEHGDTEPLDGTTGDDDANFDEAAFLAVTERANQLSVDPLLPAPVEGSPRSYVPPANSPAAAGAAVPPPAGFDAAPYIGAFEPGGTDWTAGWTSFPEN